MSLSIPSLANPLVQLQALLLLAIALGGGGAGYGMFNLVIQLAALAVVAANGPLVWKWFADSPRFLVGLVIATVAFPLLQIVPVPPDVWQSLPGRELVRESFDLVSLSPERWFPVSMDSSRTLVAFFGTIVPATIIVIGSALPYDQKRTLAWTVVAGALIVVVLGSLQLASANTLGLLYPESLKPDVLYATFSNRNSTGAFFVLTLALIAALPLPKGTGWRIAIASGAIILAIGVILTQSRSSMVLLLLVAAFASVRLAYSQWQVRYGSTPAQKPTILVGAILAILCFGAVAISAGTGGRAEASFDRFNRMDTDRPEMWEDGIYAAGVYWPVGTGMGTFDDVFQVHESLEYVSARRAGRAHNDFIEIAIEGGLAAVIILLGWLGWCAFAALRPADRETRWDRLGAGVGIACLALQSTLDYPLRNQTLLAVGAVFIVLLFHPRSKKA